MFDAIRRDVSAEHELPVEAIVLIKAGSIPKTSSGKIQRHACRDGFLDGTLEVVGQWRAWDAAERDAASRSSTATPTARPRHRSAANGHGAALPTGRESATAKAPPPSASHSRKRRCEIVLEQVRRIAKERAGDLTLDTNILELGLDSLERMEIVAALEETFGGRFPEDVLAADGNLPRSGRSGRGLSRQDAARRAAATRRPTRFPPENYRFELFPEYLRPASRTCRSMQRHRAWRIPTSTLHERVTNDTTLIDGRELINFSSYNYLGMSGDPAVVAAAQGSDRPLRHQRLGQPARVRREAVHRELEQAIAELHRHARRHRVRRRPFDQRNDDRPPVRPRRSDPARRAGPQQHRAGLRSCRGARRRPFPHNDWQALDQLLAELRGEYRRVLIAIEGVYSMDGDYPDLPRFIEVKKRHKAFLHGRRGAFGRRAGAARPRHRRAFRRRSGRRRSLDGHAQQVVRQLRRLHRRQQGARRVL